MAFYINQAGNAVHVDVKPEVYAEARAANQTVQELLNTRYRDADTSRGSAFRQLAASTGITLPQDNPFGLRAGRVDDVVEGRLEQTAPGMEAAGVTNTSDRGAPFGNSARVLFPVAIMDMVENMIPRNYGADTPTFEQMIAQTITLPGENFIQPIIDYSGDGGPMSAKANRVTEFAEPGNILRIGVSEVARSLPAFTIGVEYSDKAQRALTIDVLAATIARYTQVEQDSRVYEYIATLFNGDNDLVKGAVPAVNATDFDSASSGGVLTHKAWLKWLAKNRRFRTITHVMGDIDAYMAVEARTGRPGTNNYDPTLARVDPQARLMNLYGFGNDVKWFITDSVADGGPVPAGEIWGLDATQAITKVKNAAADYKASESFALRRSSAMRWDWGEAVIRRVGDVDLKPFTKLRLQ